MDDFARVLTGSRDEKTAAYLGLIEDSVQCTGSVSVLHQVEKRLQKFADNASRQHVVLRSLECGLETGSFRRLPEHQGNATPQQLERRITEIKKGSDGAATVCIVLERLSDILLQTPVAEVLSRLEQLRQRPDVSCIVGLLHTDLHSSQVLYAVESMAKCVLRVQPVWAGAKSSEFPESDRVDGSVLLQDKRRTGRVQTKQQWYQLQADGSLAVADKLDKEAVQIPIPTESKPVSEPQRGQQGMRIDLTPEELLARGSVALPYEQHTKAAGKADPAQKPLGQILYIRDSESEHDSDEDPDDDLDI